MFNNYRRLISKLGYAGHTHKLVAFSAARDDGAAVAGLVPVGSIVAFHGDPSALPPQWAVCNGTAGTPDLRDRFIRGAQDDVTGGATPGSTGGVLTYDISHGHNVSVSLNASANHGHTGQTGGAPGSNDKGQASGNGGLDAAAGGHVHAVTWNATGTHSHNVFTSVGGASLPKDKRPPWFGLYYARYQGVSETSTGWIPTNAFGQGFSLSALWQRFLSHQHVEHNIGQLPIGSVVAWQGGTYPSGWALCDGSPGTPNLVNKYIVTAGLSYGLGSEGGTATHDWSHGHSSSSSSDSQGSHAHSLSVGGPNATAKANSRNDEPEMSGMAGTNHSHSIADNAAGGHAHTVSTSIGGVGSAYENRPGSLTMRYLKRIV